MTYYERSELEDDLILIKNAKEKGLTIEELISELEEKLKRGD